MHLDTGGGGGRVNTLTLGVRGNTDKISWQPRKGERGGGEGRVARRPPLSAMLRRALRGGGAGVLPARTALACIFDLFSNAAHGELDLKIMP